MFRRFMIVCWVLFAIGASISLIGYVGYIVNQEPELTTRVRELPPDAVLEELTLEQKRANALADAGRRIEREDRQVRREYFLITATIGGIFVGILLLWNVIWHTAHWVWMGRNKDQL